MLPPDPPEAAPAANQLLAAGTLAIRVGAYGQPALA